jgi:hypothetical protein
VIACVAAWSHQSGQIKQQKLCKQGIRSPALPHCVSCCRRQSCAEPVSPAWLVMVLVHSRCVLARLHGTCCCCRMKLVLDCTHRSCAASCAVSLCSSLPAHCRRRECQLGPHGPARYVSTRPPHKHVSHAAVHCSASCDSCIAGNLQPTLKISVPLHESMYQPVPLIPQCCTPPTVCFVLVFHACLMLSG